MMRGRQFALTLLASATLALVSCSRLAPSEKENELEAATGDKAMWYRYTFEAEYQGEPFKIDQMVTCVSSIISGGGLGQSPDSVITEARPMSAAAKMADGSQILVRIPNMCGRYRKFEYEPDEKYPDNPAAGSWGYKRGWKSRGPHSVIPLVIWSDKMPRPDIIESYVAAEYYQHPDARITNPKGTLDLWPVGQYPKNYKEVLQQEVALPRYPNPFINPALSPNGKGKGRDGQYHGVGDNYAAYTITPVVNYNQWVQKYGQLSKQYGRAKAVGKALPDTQGVFIEALNDRATSAPMQADGDFTHPRFRAFTGVGGGGQNYEQFGAIESEPTFVTSDCVGIAFVKLLLGKPNMSTFPLDAKDYGSVMPDLVRVGSSDGKHPDARARHFNREQRERNCQAQLGKMRSFDIINGRLDASRSMPGMIVSRKWHGESERPYLDTFSRSFLASGAIQRVGDIFIFRLRIEGVNIDYPLLGRKVYDSPYPVMFEDKNSGQWYIINTTGDSFFIGEGEDSVY